MSQNGKGSARRIGENPDLFAKNYDRIFKKKRKTKVKKK